MKKSLLLLSAIALLFFAGCDLDGRNSRTGSLMLKFGNQDGKAFFGPVLAVSSYELTGTGPEGKSLTASWQASPSYTIANLTAGMWNFTVKGIDAESVVIGIADFSVTILPHVANEATLTLEPVGVGQGAVSLAVTWEALGSLQGEPSLSIEYEKADDSAVKGTIQATVSGAAATASASLGAGYYFLDVRLSVGQYEKFAWNRQSFRIAVGKTTNIALQCDYTPPEETEAGLEFDGSLMAAALIDFQGKPTMRVSLKNVSAGTIYLNKANVSPYSVSGDGTGKALPDPLPASDSMTGPLRGPAAMQASSNPLLFDNPRAMGFVPPATRDISPKAAVETIAIGEEDPAMVIGSTKKFFWVESGTGQWIQEPATLRAKADTVYIWVPDKYYSEVNTAPGDNMLSQMQIDVVKDKFNGPSPYNGLDGIRALVTKIFSFENGGEPDGDGGIDGDQHISVLLFDIDYDYTPGQQGGILGYYWPKDEYPDNQMVLQGLRSNEAEIFYIDVHFLDIYPQMMYSCLGHEYQHMIHFNQKDLLRGVETPIWFNEMCSMVTEDFIASRIGVPVGYTPVSRIPLFNASYYESGVTDWLSGSEILKSYASAYTFGAFLARNFGGAPLFSAMIKSDSGGVEAITRAVSELGTAASFEEVFRKYSTAFVFEQNALPVVRAFPALDTWCGGVLYSMPSFSLYDFGPEPALFEENLQVPLRPYGNCLHSSLSWRDMQDGSTIILEKPADDNVQFMLMYKEGGQGGEI